MDGCGHRFGRTVTARRGIPVVGFTIASTPRTFDRERTEFVDGEPLFLRCSLWRQAAENAAQSLQRGMRVIVNGRLKQRTCDDKESQRRTVVEVDAEEVAPSLTRRRPSPRSPAVPTTPRPARDRPLLRSPAPPGRRRLPPVASRTRSESSGTWNGPRPLTRS
ncbi:single-stranded DNA-binding protein [Streptomyces sp. 061-3]|uniref:single-stranded DNA-binding protein n=1 Tax=Streptomyces sp. 061-3 TaxID=2789268 RepID=UPI00397F06BF